MSITDMGNVCHFHHNIKHFALNVTNHKENIMSTEIPKYIG